MRELTLEEISQVNGGFDWAMFAVEFAVVVGGASVAIPAGVAITTGLVGISVAYLTGYAVGLGINYVTGAYDDVS